MKVNPILLWLFLASALAGCAAQPRTVQLNNTPYTYQESQGNTVLYRDSFGSPLVVEHVGEAAQVHLDGEIYRVSGADGQVTVTFPDGRELTRQELPGGGSAGLSRLEVSASLEDWQRVDDLREIVFQTRRSVPASRNNFILFVALLIIPAGALEVINPRLAWQVSEGWKLQDVEPSGLYLALLRAGGVVMLAVGLFLLISMR